MADIFLNAGESLTGIPGANHRYFGNTGAETVGLSATGTTATISQTVETVTLPGNSGDYLYQQSGNQLLVFSGATKVATITLQNDADGTGLTFANGKATATVSAAGLVLTGTSASTPVSQTAPAAVVIPGLTTTVSSTFTLTENTDVATANVFNSLVVVSPALTDRVNTLQDEDVLTGSDTSATANNILNAQLGNANDNGGTTITPILNNIQTLNLQFTGSSTAPNSNNAVTDLDVQDGTGIKAINITRVTQSVNAARVENIKSVVSNFSITNTNANNTGGVEFSFGNDTLKGANTAQLDLSNVQVGNINIGQNNPGGVGAFGVTAQGYETLTINSVGSPNTVGTLNLPMDTGTTGKVSIIGTQNLTLANSSNVFNAGTNTVESVQYTGGILQANGRLASIDASGFTGALTLNIAPGLLTTGKADTSGVDQNVSIIGGSGADTFILQDVLQTGDSITGGDGIDKIIVTGTGSINAASSVVTKVETVESRIAQGGTATIDFDKLPDVTGVLVRNEGANPAGTAPAAQTAVFTLNNLTAAQAQAIRIEHSNTGSNGILQNTINASLKVATGTADVVAVTIGEGLNQDPRFNFILNTQPGAPAASSVESITLIDADSESNTVALGSVATHTGTLTLGTAAGAGKAGTFLNLDTTTAGANGGLYQYQIAGNGETTSTPAGPGVGRLADQSLTAGQVRWNGAVVNAAAETSDVIVRVGATPAAISVNGAQTITLGAGNDTVIFDLLNDSRAGLTIADTVTGGAGTDTLALDGGWNAGVPQGIIIGASEWTNVSQFENFRVIGNNGFAGSNAAGAVNAYNLTLTNNLLATNKDATGYTNVIADNDLYNNTARTTAAAGATPIVNDAGLSTGGVTIDARDLSAGSKWSFKGNEGTGRADDRIILADPNIDGNAIIDGGAIDNITDNAPITPTAGLGNFGNNDVIEVRNAAVVALGDLANVKNIGTLSFTNDTAVMQVSTLQLNDTIVDALVDSFQASVSRASAATAQVEVLRINAIDNTNVAAATTGITVDAGTLTDKSDLRIVLGRGINNVTTGNGMDRVVLLGNYSAASYVGVIEDGVNINTQNTGAVVTARFLTAAEGLRFGGGTDTLVTYGAINIAAATITGLENIIANSALILSAAQYRAIVAAGGTITFQGNDSHQLRIIGDGGAALDLSKIILAGGSLVYDVRDTGGVANATTNAPVDSSATGDPTPGNVETNASLGAVVNLTAGGNFTGQAGVNNTFQGAVATLNGTTITGTAADTETLQITDAAAVQIGNGTTGGTVTNIDVLTLANATNNITFAAGTGITTVNGGTGADTINLTNLAANASVALGAGNDTLTLDNVTRTGTLNGGDGTDTLTLTAAANLAGATISGFETINGNFAATLTRAQYGAAAVTNNQAITFSDAGAVTLQTTAPVVVLANGANTVTATAATDFNITGGTGADTVNFGTDLKSTDTFAAGTGSDVLQITGNGTGSANITGVETIQVNSASAATFTTGAIAPGVASTITLAGSTGAITLNASNYAPTTSLTIVDGAGNDTIIVPTADASRGITTVTLSTGGADQVTITNGAFNGTTTNSLTLNNFTTAVGANQDKVLGLGIATYQTATAANTAVTAANSLVEIEAATGSLSNLFDAGDTGTAEQVIDAALGNYGGADGSSFYTIVYGTGAQAGNAALYQVNVTTAANGITQANTAIELVATFNGVAVDSFVQSNFI